MMKKIFKAALILVLIGAVASILRDYGIYILIAAVIIIGIVIARKMKKKKAAEPVKPAMPAEVPNPEEKKIKTITVPQSIGGKPVAYKYELEFVPELGIDIENDVISGEQRKVDLDADGEQIRVIYDGKTIGKVFDSKKAEMVSDFQRKGEPIFAKLSGDGKMIYTFFYRDKRKGQEWREQTRCKVSKPKKSENEYYSEEDLYVITEGEEMDYEVGTDENLETVVYLYSCASIIGKLPKKYSERIAEKKPYGIFADGEEDGSLYVTIYW